MLFEIKRNCLSSGSNQSLYLFIRRVKTPTEATIRSTQVSLAVTYRIESNILVLRLTPYANKTTGDHLCELGCNTWTTDHTLYSAFNKYSRKNGNTSGAVHHLSTDIKKAYDSVGRDVLYNMLIEFDIPMKLVGLTMRYLN
jgi:hypothetical protein